VIKGTRINGQQAPSDAALIGVERGVSPAR